MEVLRPTEVTDDNGFEEGVKGYGFHSTMPHVRYRCKLMLILRNEQAA